MGRGDALVGKFMIDKKYGVQSIFANFTCFIIGYSEILLEYEGFFSLRRSQETGYEPGLPEIRFFVSASLSRWGVTGVKTGTSLSAQSSPAVVRGLLGARWMRLNEASLHFPRHFLIHNRWWSARGEEILRKDFCAVEKKITGSISRGAQNLGTELPRKQREQQRLRDN